MRALGKSHGSKDLRRESKIRQFSLHLTDALDYLVSIQLADTTPFLRQRDGVDFL